MIMILIISSFLFGCLVLYILYDFIKQNNMRFVDFKIGTVTYSTKNIYNKTVECIKMFYIYKSWCYGLIKIPLRFNVQNGWKITNKAEVQHTGIDFASLYDSKYKCEQLIKDIKENPNKYILTI